MASIVQLKRSALSGKVPDTGSLNLGELAVNTYDGKIYFKKSGSIESVESVVTTNSVVTGSIRLEGTGSFGSLKVNDTLTVNHGVSVISGSLGITSDLTVLGSVNARQFNIAIISSSTLFESGSSNFGNSLDDTHTFTGSVNITGSFLLNGQEVGGGTTSGSFTGSFTGDGSGLRGVVTDDLPIDGWDYDSNSSASISEFNNESRKYLIDFQWDTEVGTPVGFKTFISNVTGSTQIVPTEEGIKFIVGNEQVALVGPNGIESVPPAGTVSGSSQLTSSYDERYVLSGSITQTTWDNIASKPSGIISGSSQLTSSVLATTGSNTFVGTQILSGSILPAIDNTYDLGSATYQWRDIYVSSGSLYIDGTKVLSSTNQELQITTDEGQSIKILEAGSDSIILQSADGDIQLKTSGGGNLLFDPTTGLIDVRGTLQIQDGNKVTSSGGNGVVFGNNIVVSGSLESTGNINGVNISTFSSSVATQISTIQTNTGSTNTRLDTIEGKYATTGSNIFIGTQVFTGSVYITSDLIVQGSSSLQDISASAVSIGTNIVKLNTAFPAIRYAGLSIVDSGSSGVSASLLWDSQTDDFIFTHRSAGSETLDSSMFIYGPLNTGSLDNIVGILPNRLTKGESSNDHTHHITSSQISDDGTTVSIPGNLVVTGSISTNTGFGLKYGSFVSTTGHLNLFSGIVGSTYTLNLRNGTNGNETALNFDGSANRNYTFPNTDGTLALTSNLTSLATTGSNTFSGTISINSGTTGFLTLGASNSYGSVSSGGGGATIYLNGATRGGTTYAASNTLVVATDGEFYITNGAANSTKFVVASNGNATLSGTFTENSSIRYKENVETIKYGLDKVLQMRGVTYDKKDNGVKEMGVIAEEIYDVLPEVVLKNEEGEIDSVSYGRITAVLIEAIKDLKKEIEDLKANR
jgi:hypothetical protein